jgi:hypothetical protein
MPHVVSICYTPDGVERRPADRFARVVVAEAVLVEGHGIDGDAKGGRDKHGIDETTLPPATWPWPTRRRPATRRKSQPWVLSAETLITASRSACGHGRLRRTSRLLIRAGGPAFP